MNTPAANVTMGEGVDMVATSADGATSVLVGIVEPSAQTTGKTAEDLLKSQTEELQKSLEGNYTYTSEEADITFNGMTRTLPASITKVTMEGKSIVLGMAVAEKEGYFLDVVVTGTSEDDVVNAFKNFKAISE